MSHSYYFVSVEPSGDAVAAQVMAHIETLEPQARIRFSAASEMVTGHAERASIDLSGLAILGWVDAIGALSRVKRAASEVADDILAAKPDIVVLTDSWGFTLRVAQILKTAAPELRLVKLIGPQIWASRPGRARTVAAHYDLVCCVLPEELDHYASLPIQAIHIGVPALDGFVLGDATRFRTVHGLEEGYSVCLVCPGSRESEAKRVAPDLIEAGRALVSRHRGMALVIAPAPNISSDLRRRTPPENGEIWLSDAEALRDAMSTASIAFACSGTITTQLAAAGVPTLVGYRVGALTYGFARIGFLKSRYISLLNAAANEEILPEYIQRKLNPERLIETAEAWLGAPDGLINQRRRQANALSVLRVKEKPASEIAARAILSVSS